MQLLSLFSGFECFWVKPNYLAPADNLKCHYLATISTEEVNLPQSWLAPLLKFYLSNLIRKLGNNKKNNIIQTGRASGQLLLSQSNHNIDLIFFLPWRIGANKKLHLKRNNKKLEQRKKNIWLGIFIEWLVTCNER